MIEVKHLIDRQGYHCLEVNGERGPVERYEAICFHPAGFAAKTEYYEGYYIDTPAKAEVFCISAMPSNSKFATVEVEEYFND